MQVLGFFSCADDVNSRYVFFIFYFKDMCLSWFEIKQSLSLIVILTLKVEANFAFCQIYLDARLDSRAQWRRKLEAQVCCDLNDEVTSPGCSYDTSCIICLSTMPCGLC